MFVRNDSAEVIRLTRELLPASLTAASVLVATDLDLTHASADRLPRADLVVDLAGHIGRALAKNYLEGWRRAWKTGPRRAGNSGPLTPKE